MRVDFYQLSHHPAPVVAAMLAQKTRAAGGRMLVVSADPDQLGEISEALWASKADTFLANGMAGGPHDARQPILLSGELINANAADFLMLADGEWRDPGEGFARVMLLFDIATIDSARGTWRALAKAAGVERHYWSFKNGRWDEWP